jgi:DNA-binding MarR family transcriptional regulator
MKSPQSLDSNILFLCGQITKRVHEQLTREFNGRQFNVTVEQFSILAYLWYSEGANQQQLAEVLERDKTTIARVIRNMEKKNLLVRISDKEDQRAKLIYLTESGRKLRDEMIDASAQVYSKALENLEDDELSAGLELLQKIHQNLIQ